MSATSSLLFFDWLQKH